MCFTFSTWRPWMTFISHLAGQFLKKLIFDFQINGFANAPWQNQTPLESVFSRDAFVTVASLRSNEFCSSLLRLISQVRALNKYTDVHLFSSQAVSHSLYHFVRDGLELEWFTRPFCWPCLNNLQTIPLNVLKSRLAFFNRNIQAFWVTWFARLWLVRKKSYRPNNRSFCFCIFHLFASRILENSPAKLFRNPMCKHTFYVTGILCTKNCLWIFHIFCCASVCIDDYISSSE